MRLGYVLAAATILCATAPVVSSPASAQVQLNVCGAPPLPPCGPGRRPPPPDYDREDGGVVCRTRYQTCRVGRPRPIDARCTCEDDDGERVVGRIIR